MTLEELKAELAKHGYKAIRVRPKAPYKFKTPGFRWYSSTGGAAYDEVVGVKAVYQGPLYQGPTWPSDIAAFYEGKLQ